MARRPLRFSFDAASDLFAREAERIYDPIAEASSAAIRQAADQIKVRGRANIAAAGFGPKWQNTLRVDVYPKGNRVSANAAALVWHKIGYADVFEAGATIKGSPLLWLPLPSTPKKVGRQKLTPARFANEVGPLVSLTRNTSKPLLGAPMVVTASAARRGAPYKVTLPALRRGASAARRNDKSTRIVVRTIPLFHGVRQVTLRRRFSISDIIRGVVDDLPAFYRSALKGV